MMRRISTKAFILGSVAVAASNPSGQCSECHGTKTVRPKLARPSELPIYDHNSWHKVKDCKVETKSNFLEEYVRSARLAVTDVCGSLSDSTASVANFVATGKAHTIGAVYYLREDSNVLPRIGAIAAGALTGLLFGIRGKFFKRLIYSSLGAGAVTSICYPNEAVQVSKSSFTIAKYYAIIGYKRVQDELSNKREEKVKVNPKVEEKPVDIIGEQTTKKPDVLPPPPKTVDKVGKDYGQSNPEDRDMYTTRGS